MPSVDTSNRNPKRLEPVKMPRAQWTRFKPNPLGLGALSRIVNAKTSGVDEHLPAQTLLPFSSTTHTLVSFSETSSPTYCFMAALLFAAVPRLLTRPRLCRGGEQPLAITLCRVLTSGSNFSAGLHAIHIAESGSGSGSQVHRKALSRIRVRPETMSTERVNLYRTLSADWCRALDIEPAAFAQLRAGRLPNATARSVYEDLLGYGLPPSDQPSTG